MKVRVFLFLRAFGRRQLSPSLTNSPVAASNYHCSSLAHSALFSSFPAFSSDYRVDFVSLLQAVCALQPAVAAVCFCRQLGAGSSVPSSSLLVAAAAAVHSHCGCLCLWCTCRNLPPCLSASLLYALTLGLPHFLVRFVCAHWSIVSLCQSVRQ